MTRAGNEPDDDQPMTVDLACFDAAGDSVFVLPSAICDDCGNPHLITVAVRDTDAEVFTRAHCRELIDLEPLEALRLARELITVATVLLTPDDDDQPD